MTKFLSTLGFFGCFALFAGMYLNAPGAGPVEAREEAATLTCPLVEVALDEGYGISRTELRPVCTRR